MVQVSVRHRCLKPLIDKLDGGGRPRGGATYVEVEIVEIGKKLAAVEDQIVLRCWWHARRNHLRRRHDRPLAKAFFGLRSVPESDAHRRRKVCLFAHSEPPSPNVLIGSLAPSCFQTG